METSYRVVVTDDNLHIYVTSYRDRNTLARIEVDSLIALKIADDLIGAARRRLDGTTALGKPVVEQLSFAI